MREREGAHVAMSALVLAGDIGGTSTRIGLFEVVGGRLDPVVKEHYVSREHSGLDAMVRAFRATHAQPIAGACFGVPGPVVHGRVEAPNLAWGVDAAVVARAIDLPEVGLINDLEANAHGIFTLPPADLVVLNEGAPGAVGNIAVVSAGTGLGEAGMYWDGAEHHPFATEGGHADFGAHSDLEVDLLRHLRARFGSHVSAERVVSGPGIANIYEFLRDTGRGAEPEWLARAIREGDPPAVITRAALEGKSDLCAKALDLFVAAYGDEAGNLALKLMARGGVYLGGGIAPRIVDRLRGPAFMQAFTAKGRLEPLLRSMPVKVIVNDQTALFGAARWAALHAHLIQPVPR
jgi:glucokinase